MIKLRAKKIIELFEIPSEKSQNYFLELTSAMGIDSSGIKLKPEGPVGIKPRQFIVKTTVSCLTKLGIETNEAEIEDIFKQVDQASSKNLATLLKLLPGVLDFLSQCTHAKIEMAIATTDLSDRALKAMQALKIDHHFKMIAGADMVKNTKPAPDLGYLITNHLNIPCASCIMVGDHQVDIDMGFNSNFGASIGVQTGLGGEKDGHLRSDFLIKDFTELELVIENKENENQLP